MHLKVHSAYSLLEEALQISSLAKLAGALRMPAVGLTDTNNMFGVLEFSDKLAAAGIQPIAGCALQTDFGDSQGAAQARVAPPDAGARPAGALAFLCGNEAGYANLMKLGSACHLKPALTEPPHVKLVDLARHSIGLIALTGGPDGPVDSAIRAGQEPLARQRLERLAAMFPGSLYVELQRHGLAHEQEVEPRLLQLAYALGLPIVATNECYFAKPDDYEAHDALICIAGGNYVVEDNRRRLSREHYFKSADEMARLFADLPEALASTIEIAKRCAFRPRGRKPILPRFVQAAPGTGEEQQLAIEAEELRRQAEAGLEARLAAQQPAPGFTVQDYSKRLDFELSVIAKMKFPGYFLIVADFIKWAKAHGIPVGPGRGSGAGLGGGLVAHHHRPRSTAVRPPVRALPEPRAHLDAGLRHRLLPGPARRGDPLRPAEIRRRPRGADHHARQACRRVPCCATWAACCRCPTARSTSSASSCPATRPTR